ncbi:MAG: VWA domain-containing protein [Dehalococcoidia bacterium]|nr:MAG: VWA domain-containing protein [Dehalococcoidia bacterium]
MSFYNPWFLLFIPVVFLLGYFIKNKKRNPGFRFSSTGIIRHSGKSLRMLLFSNLIYIRCAALSLMLIALARPQTPVQDSLRRSDAVDIILTVDVSASMLAEDFNAKGKRQNRIDAVKSILPDFISSRKNDRVGMVIFATRAFIAAPLTFNHEWVLTRAQDLQAGVLGNRTAIGSAIATSLNRLKRSKAKSKVIILLTDGRNNAGEITPETASAIAKALGVKLYTIGVGTYGLALFPIRDNSGSVMGYNSIKTDIDEPLLRNIARETGGRYFRVSDIDSLKKVYKEIDHMEKLYMEERAYDEYNELFGRFLIAGLFVLLLEIGLSNTILRKIP